MVIDTTKDRTVLFFYFTGPATLVLRAEESGNEGRHTAPDAKGITDRGPISARLE